MLRLLPTGRDKSGQSRQSRKHWCACAPSQVLRLGRTRDRNPTRSVNGRLFEVDFDAPNRQPMSWSAGTADANGSI
jgi:hypothetical protein